MYGPLTDILQDRRYWLIHLLTVPALFNYGIIFVLTGSVYKLHEVMFQQSYLEGDNSSISLIKNRLPVFSSFDDIL